MIHPLTNRLLGFSDLHEEMDRVFKLFLNSNGSSRPDLPAVNLWEDAEKLHAEFELPGVAMEDIAIDATQEELKVSGKRQSLAVAKGEDERVLRRERSSGSFERTLALPFAVDAEGAQASFQDGVLTISLPKAATLRPRRIAIEAPKN
jgi:HSP20 family protein